MRPSTPGCRRSRRQNRRSASSGERRRPSSFTQVNRDRIGVEGTGSYGAGITRHLADAGIEVLEVDRPDRSDRHRKVKDDDLDAISAARAALCGQRTSTPKSKDGAVESLRVLRVTRSTAVRARRDALQLTGQADFWHPTGCFTHWAWVRGLAGLR